MTKEMITELISEAEALADRVDQHGVGDSDRSIVRRLVAAVKALEAATPTSTANDREALAKLMFNAVRADESLLFEEVAPWVRSIYLSHADVALAAGVSRAAVPTPDDREAQAWKRGAKDMAAAIEGEDLLARLMDTLAYYHCRSTNPKADSPFSGYHAMAEDQREFLRERHREAAEEVLRMWQADCAAVPERETEWEYGISLDGAAPFWYSMGVPFLTVDDAERVAKKSFLQTYEIWRRRGYGVPERVPERGEG